MLNEVWKPIPLEWAEKYEISNFGRIRNKKTQKIRKLQKDGWNYDVVVIRYHNKYKMLYAHRAVALAFIPNDDPENKIHVSHLDETRDNNTIENLTWATVVENMNMPLHKERLKTAHKTHSAAYKQLTRQIIQYDLKGNKIAEYDSARDAANATNIDIASIYKVCNRIRLTAGGFIWDYKTEEVNNNDRN